METVWIFEQFYIDGCGKKRVVDYVPVINKEIGHKLIDAAIKAEDLETNYDVVELPDKVGVMLKVKKSVKCPVNVYDGHCFVVTEQSLMTEENLFRAEEAIQKEKTNLSINDLFWN